MLEYKHFIGFGTLTFLIVSLCLRGRRPKTPVWGIMAFASFITVVSGLEPIETVGYSIDLNVILFLIGFFSIASLAESSGLLTAIAYWVLSRAKSIYALMYFSVFLFGIMAAFMVNDTVALVGPPISYVISRVSGVDPKVSFLLLMFSITVGSVMTPIGNPQNMLIAIKSGMNAPFIYFLAKLALPTMINLAVTTYIVLKFFKVKNNSIDFHLRPSETIKNGRDALLAGIGLIVTVFVLVVNDLLALSGMPHIAQRGFIPLIVATAMYIVTSEPRKVLAGVDWGTIIFFITMFVAMDGIWRSGVLQPLLNAIHPYKFGCLLDIASITALSVIVSQALSNVPFTNIYVEYMKSLGYTGFDVNSWLTLAFASTVAGNLTLLGAASNIIVIEMIESKYGLTVTFKEFFKVGVIVTSVNLVIYLAFLLI